MDFQFDFLKTLQAVGVLLDYERTRRMNYMRLLKLLYIADRESLVTTGHPITGDHALAMKRGPVLSRVYDLNRGMSPQAGKWEQFVHTDRYEVELRGDPGRGELSRHDVARLQDISERYRNLDEWAMSEETHQFEEWRNHFAGGDSAAPIPWEQALRAAGKPEMVEDVRRDEAARQVFDKVLGR
jgi:uncharacterized phage-associated protein